MTRKRSFVSALVIVALALGYELAVRLLAARDPIAAASRAESGPLALCVLALALRISLLGFVPAWACYTGALALHAAWQRRQSG